MIFPIFFPEVKSVKGQLIQAVAWALFALLVAYEMSQALSVKALNSPVLTATMEKMNDNAAGMFSLNWILLAEIAFGDLDSDELVRE
jgi:hypothetical protein